MARCFFITVPCLALAVAACSDTDGNKADAGRDIQTSKPNEFGAEASVTDTRVDDKNVVDMKPQKSALGGGCKTNVDCQDSTAMCLEYSRLFAATAKTKLGICTKKCTPDNPSTTTIEDSCPTGFKCSAFKSTAGTARYCLKKCTPSQSSNPCPKSSGQTCHPMSTRWSGILPLDAPQAVCIYPACKTNKDCPVFIGTTCTSDAECQKVKPASFCEISSSKCALAGNCTAGGLCGKHSLGSSTAKVGSPCKSSLDCPGNGACMVETTSSSAIGVHYRNGYCIIPNCVFGKDLPDFACPYGSSCYRFMYGGACFKTCSLTKASDCRGYSKDKGGDYECYSWKGILVGGKDVAEDPLCQSAAGQTCNSLSVECGSIGLPAKAGRVWNITKMSCRDRYTGAVKSNKKDPTGVCLDNTASGPFSKP